MRVRVVALCAGLAGACTNNTQAPTPADPHPIVAQLAAAQCRKILECCSTDELAAVLGPEPDDQASCETAIVSQAEAFFLPALERALADETIALQDAELPACIAALDARSCDEFQPFASADVLELAGCTSVVEPRLTLSGFCTDDFECDTGFCSHPPADTQGACKNPPQVDEECLHDRCADGLACTVDGLCAEKLGSGEVCTRNADCLSDLCMPDESGELVCETVTEICTG